MARGVLNMAGLARVAAAVSITVVAQASLALVVARYDFLSPFNGLWMLGVPIAIGLLAFRTWPARLWSLPPLLIVGVLAIMATGLLW